MALKAILAWAQTPKPDICQFPWPASLQSLSTTAAFRKFPLVDWIARRFAYENTEKHLQIALKTLHEVLENAENVSSLQLLNAEGRTLLTREISRAGLRSLDARP